MEAKSTGTHNPSSETRDGTASHCQHDTNGQTRREDTHQTGLTVSAAGVAKFDRTLCILVRHPRHAAHRWAHQRHARPLLCRPSFPPHFLLFVALIVGHIQALRHHMYPDLCLLRAQRRQSALVQDVRASLLFHCHLLSHHLLLQHLCPHTSRLPRLSSALDQRLFVSRCSSGRPPMVRAPVSRSDLSRILTLVSLPPFLVLPCIVAPRAQAA